MTTPSLPPSDWLSQFQKIESLIAGIEKSLKSALGDAWTLPTADDPVLLGSVLQSPKFDQVDKSYKPRIVSIIFQEYFKRLVDAFRDNSAGATAEQLNAHVSSRKISFALDDLDANTVKNRYCDIQIRDCVLVMVVPHNYLYFSTSDCCRSLPFLLSRLQFTPVPSSDPSQPATLPKAIPGKWRRSLTEMMSTKHATMQQNLRQALGDDTWRLMDDKDLFWCDLSKIQYYWNDISSNQDRVPSIIFDQYLRHFIESFLVKGIDDAGRSLLNKYVTNHYLYFTIEELDSNAPCNYCDVQLRDGCLVLVVPPKKLLWNTSDCGNALKHLIKKLETQDVSLGEVKEPISAQITAVVTPAPVPAAPVSLERAVTPTVPVSTITMVQSPSAVAVVRESPKPVVTQPAVPSTTSAATKQREVTPVTSSSDAVPASGGISPLFQDLINKQASKISSLNDRLKKALGQDWCVLDSSDALWLLPTTDTEAWSAIKSYQNRFPTIIYEQYMAPMVSCLEKLPEEQKETLNSAVSNRVVGFMFDNAVIKHIDVKIHYNRIMVAVRPQYFWYSTDALQRQVKELLIETRKTALLNAANKARDDYYLAHPNSPRMSIDAPISWANAMIDLVPLRDTLAQDLVAVFAPFGIHPTDASWHLMDESDEQWSLIAKTSKIMYYVKEMTQELPTALFKPHMQWLLSALQKVVNLRPETALAQYPQFSMGIDVAYDDGTTFGEVIFKHFSSSSSDRTRRRVRVVVGSEKETGYCTIDDETNPGIVLYVNASSLRPSLSGSNSSGSTADTVFLYLLTAANELYKRYKKPKAFFIYPHQIKALEEYHAALEQKINGFCGDGWTIMSVKTILELCDKNRDEIPQSYRAYAHELIFENYLQGIERCLRGLATQEDDTEIGAYLRDGFERHLKGMKKHIRFEFGQPLVQTVRYALPGYALHTCDHEFMYGGAQITQDGCFVVTVPLEHFCTNASDQPHFLSQLVQQHFYQENRKERIAFLRNVYQAGQLKETRESALSSVLGTTWRMGFTEAQFIELIAGDFRIKFNHRASASRDRTPLEMVYDLIDGWITQLESLATTAPTVVKAVFNTGTTGNLFIEFTIDYDEELEILDPVCEFVSFAKLSPQGDLILRINPHELPNIKDCMKAVTNAFITRQDPTKWATVVERVKAVQRKRREAEAANSAARAKREAERKRERDAKWEVQKMLHRAGLR